MTAPLSSLNIVLTPMCYVPLYWPLKFLITYVGAVNVYLHNIGIVRSFPLARLGYIYFISLIIFTIFVIPLSASCDIIAVLWALISDKNQFYVINKQVSSKNVQDVP